MNVYDEYHHLFDADTNKDLGPATVAQRKASNSSDDLGWEGLIWIDAEGDVLRLGGGSPQAGARCVFTEMP